MEDNLSSIVCNKLFNKTEIESRRQEIRHVLLARSPSLDGDDFTAMKTSDLAEMFAAYDGQFFDGRFAPLFEGLSDQLTFRLSRRMTSTGGTTSFRKIRGASSSQRQFEIAVSTTLLFNTRYEFASKARVGGLLTASRLDALMRIFEHELIHLIELCLWEESSCAGKRFRSIVYRMFGHTQSNHQLVTPAESAKTDFGIEIGDSVCFTFQGANLSGFVNSIRRRATVLVEHGDGELYRDGKRYVRYYVPVENLSRVG